MNKIVDSSKLYQIKWLHYIVLYAEIFMLTEEIHEDKIFHFRHLKMAKHDPKPCSRIKLLANCGTFATSLSVYTF